MAWNGKMPRRITVLTDALQPFRSLKPPWHIREDLRQLERRGERVVAIDDRRDAPGGAHHGLQPGEKRRSSSCIGRTKGGLVVLPLTEGQMMDHKGVWVVLDELLSATTLIGD